MSGKIVLLLAGTALALAAFAGPGPGGQAVPGPAAGNGGPAQAPASAPAAAGTAPGAGDASEAGGRQAAALVAFGTTARRPGPGHRASGHRPGRRPHRPHHRHHHTRHRRPRGHGARPHGSPLRIAWSMLTGFGWTHRQFRYLNLLWMRESGWNRYAYNAASGAYGIPQAVPGSKMASAGPDWRTSARTQILWGMGYIKSRYATPRGAWQHELQAGWY